VTIGKTEIRTALKLERKQLIDLISRATDDQLGMPSLCEGWSNKNVLGHILGIELSFNDIYKLVRKKEGLDAINKRQAKKYENCSKEEYIRLLKKGQRKVLRLLRVTPTRIFNKKNIPVPNGHISIAQIFGDAVMDRAIHCLDIAHPLSIDSKITDPEVMSVCLKFMLRSIDLLNPIIPKSLYGKCVQLTFTGVCANTYYWELGTDKVQLEKPKDVPILKVSGDSNDFLFTIVERKALLRQSMKLEGKKELVDIFNNSLHANKLWEH
jgi:hypothetical protein